MLLAVILIATIGLVLVAIGYLIWKKEKISLLHDYHYDKVSEENKKAFCTLSGQGILIVGLGLLATAIILGTTESVLGFIAFGLGFALGLALLIYAGNKYNK